MAGNRCRNWCFTINNPTTSVDFKEDSMVYLVVGREIGENGTPHLQGFVQLRVKKRLSQVKDLIGQNPHLEIMRGTSEEAAEYCKKDGDYDEYGERSLTANEKRKENRKESCVSILKMHKAKRDVAGIIEEFPHLVKDVELLARERLTRRHFRQRPAILYLSGVTRCGKTTSAMKVFERLQIDYYVKPPANKWWPNYEVAPDFQRR